MHTWPVAARDKVDLQIRGVPVKLQRRIRERAARKGVSMSKYVIEILDQNVDRPGTLGEWMEEIAKNPPRTDLRAGEPTALIRAMRDAIDRA
jgi:plasmid stability protein